MRHIFNISFALLFVIAVAFTACSGNGSNDDILSDIEQDKGININIEISPDSITLLHGDSTALTVKVQASDTNDFRVVWSSSNTEVATVNDEGKVNALAVGEAIITVASVVDKTKKASCTINVKEPVDTKTFTVKGVSFTMKLVEPGLLFAFSSGEMHEVTITKHFYIGETEVTQALWKTVTGYSPTKWWYNWSSEDGLGDNYPAYYISYSGIEDFLKKLNNMSGVQFRLPTDAEWELAARGGDSYSYSGSDNIDEVAWYEDNSAGMFHPVKTKKANSFGLYDMSGNVWKWCSDWYDEDYPSSDVTDPTGPAYSLSGHVVRGGSINSIFYGCFNSSKTGACETTYYRDTGLRLACSIVSE